MSLAWHAIRDHLMHSSSTLGFQRHFNLIRQKYPALSHFRDPASLLDALHRQAAQSDEKNQWLSALAREAQYVGSTSDAALTFLLLALWPGLDAIRHRSIGWKMGKPSDIASDILGRATEALRGLDLGRVNRIAATVLQNIQRDMIRASRSEVARQKMTSGKLPEDLPDAGAPDGQFLTSTLLVADLERLVGADATLVIRVAIDGFSQAEAARQLGLSEEATRKRFQRAAQKLRKNFEKNE